MEFIMKKFTVLVLMLCLIVFGLFAQRPATVIRREFTTPGNHVFTFNEYFPAIVDVFILAGGGGGQGGHSKSYQQGLGSRTEHGTGASGGGGAVTFISFNITATLTMNISVGAGGAGGTRHSRGVGGSWESGNPGRAGGDSIISFDNRTIVVQGGRGGGGNAAQAISGGAGGIASTRPELFLLMGGFTSIPGAAGVNGRHNANLLETNRGGQAGRIYNHPGYESTYGGGLGALNRLQAEEGGGGRGGYGNESGTDGGHGRVLVIVRYYRQ